jgi:YD repeat-containing protein
MNSTDGYVSVNYTWDTLSRLSTVVDNRLGSQNTTTYTYDSANNVATVTYPNGFHAMLSYDDLNRMTSLTSSSSVYQRPFTGTRKRQIKATPRLNTTSDSCTPTVKVSSRIAQRRIAGSVRQPIREMGMLSAFWPYH